MNDIEVVITETEVWAMYHVEVAREEELRKAFIAADTSIAQVAALGALERQAGRVSLLRELAALKYVELQALNDSAAAVPE